MAGRGLQALVTRPREESETLAAALAVRGIDALIEPLMEVCFCASAALDLAGVQAVLCTSANGARALARAREQRKMPVLAVGGASAARGRAEGVIVVQVAPGGGDDL